MEKLINDFIEYLHNEKILPETQRFPIREI